MRFFFIIFFFKTKLLNMDLQDRECYKIQFDKSNGSFIAQMLTRESHSCPSGLASFCSQLNQMPAREVCVWGDRSSGLGRGQALLEEVLPLLRLSLSMGAPFKQNVSN